MSHISPGQFVAVCGGAERTSDRSEFQVEAGRETGPRIYRVRQCGVRNCRDGRSSGVCIGPQAS